MDRFSILVGNNRFFGEFDSVDKAEAFLVGERLIRGSDGIFTSSDGSGRAAMVTFYPEIRDLCNFPLGSQVA